MLTPPAPWGYEWLSLIMFCLVCQRQQVISHQPRKRLTLKWGQKATCGVENSPKNHSSAWPTALACPGSSKVPGPEQDLSPEGSPQHEPRMRTKGRPYMEEVADACLVRWTRARGRGTRGEGSAGRHGRSGMRYALILL